MAGELGFCKLVVVAAAVDVDVAAAAAAAAVAPRNGSIQGGLGRTLSKADVVVMPPPPLVLLLLLLLLLQLLIRMGGALAALGTSTLGGTEEGGECARPWVLLMFLWLVVVALPPRRAHAADAAADAAAPLAGRSEFSAPPNSVGTTVGITEV